MLGFCCFIDTNFDSNIIVENVQIKRTKELKDEIYQFKTPVLDMDKQVAELKIIMEKHNYTLYMPTDKVNLQQEIDLYIINPLQENEFEIIYGKNTDKFLSKKIKTKFSEDCKQLEIKINVLPYTFVSPWKNEK